MRLEKRERAKDGGSEREKRLEKWVGIMMEKKAGERERERERERTTE